MELLTRHWRVVKRHSSNPNGRADLRQNSLSANESAQIVDSDADQRVANREVLSGIELYDMGDAQRRTPGSQS